MSLQVFPPRINFWQALAGTRQTMVLLCRNTSASAATIRLRRLDAPFNASPEVLRIGPEEIAPIHVSFEAPDAPGDFRGVLIADTKDSEPFTVPLEAASVAAAPIRPLEDATLSVSANAHEFTEREVIAHYTVAIPSGAADPLTLELDAVDLPSGFVADFATRHVSPSRGQLVALVIRAPKAAAAHDVRFAVRGILRGPDVELLLPPVPVIFPSHAPPSCQCPIGMPDPTLFTIAEQLATMPDPDDVAGPGGLPPLLQVRATLAGPPIGDCCKGAKFRLTVVLDSLVGPTNSTRAAFWLWMAGKGIGGTELKAFTNSVREEIEPGAGNTVNFNGPAPTARAVVQMRHEVALVCALPPDCLCGSVGEEFFTDIELDIAGARLPKWRITVKWHVGISGQQCVIALREAVIDRVLFQTDANVFNPRKGRFIAMSADDDGDGVDNYDELMAGADPDDPASVPHQ
jgi:hypothetical protein